MADKYHKVVIAGDAGCGKTTLLINFLMNDMKDENPIPVQNKKVQVEVLGKTVGLALSSAAGYEDKYELLRVIYNGSEVILIVFAIDDPHSLNNVEYKWLPALRDECPNAPIIMVGNKRDLRNDEETQRILQIADGKEKKDKIGAFMYVECSAKYDKGVWHVFKAATLAYLEQRQQQKHDKCNLM